VTPKSDFWAVVPVKNFNTAKTRLASVLQAEQRSQLSRMMLDDVLAALSRSEQLAGVVVVTADRDVADAAQATGADVFWENANRGPAKAVAGAALQLARDGRMGVLGIMADVPLVTAVEIDRLLALHAESPAVTLAPSRDGTGTNAVVCTPPDIIEPSFGANSLATHLQNAKKRGIESNILTLTGLGLDLDRPDDLQIFIQRRSATRTARYLDTLDLGLVGAPSNPAPELVSTTLQRVHR
jgi:2-phospho-L-lactate guanylyltransferase